MFFVFVKSNRSTPDAFSIQTGFLVSSGMMNHNFQNHFICRAHAVVPKQSHISNRIFHALCNDTVAAVELAV